MKRKNTDFKYPSFEFPLRNQTQTLRLCVLERSGREEKKCLSQSRRDHREKDQGLVGFAQEPNNSMEEARGQVFILDDNWTQMNAPVKFASLLTGMN